MGPKHILFVREAMWFLLMMKGKTYLLEDWKTFIGQILVPDIFPKRYYVFFNKKQVCLAFCELILNDNIMIHFCNHLKPNFWVFCLNSIPWIHGGLVLSYLQLLYVQWTSFIWGTYMIGFEHTELMAKKWKIVKKINIVSWNDLCWNERKG